MSEKKLKKRYIERYKNVLLPLQTQLQKHICNVFMDYPRIDRVTVRAKDIDRFMEKAFRTDRGVPKYTDPISQVQDQLAGRIVTYYLSDIGPINSIVEDYFGSIEDKRIIPDSEYEFGYEGHHHILFIPDEILTPDITQFDHPGFFELQVKTLFQHAWAEANHDLGYKPPQDLSIEHRRKLAFTAAQAWGADHIFDELYINIFN